MSGFQACTHFWSKSQDRQFSRSNRLRLLAYSLIPSSTVSFFKPFTPNSYADTVNIIRYHNRHDILSVRVKQMPSQNHHPREVRLRAPIKLQFKSVSVLTPIIYPRRL